MESKIEASIADQKKSERQPLIDRNKITTKDTKSDHEEGTWEITKNVAFFSTPLIISQVFQISIEFLNIVFAGHLGSSLYVAAVGFGNMWANVTCLLVLLGCNIAVATMVSQALGSGNRPAALIYLGRARLALMILYIPTFSLSFLCEPFLLLVGGDEISAAASIAQQYATLLAVALLFQSYSDCTK
jgi:Na+-driven multidrug efflux pump